MAESISRRSNRVAGNEPSMVPAENPESILCRATQQQFTAHQPQMTTRSASSSVSWQQPSRVNQLTMLPVNLQTPQHQHQQSPRFYQNQLPVFQHIHSPMFQTPPANQPVTRGTSQQMGHTMNTSGGSNGVPLPHIQPGINVPPHMDFSGT